MFYLLIHTTQPSRRSWDGGFCARRAGRNYECIFSTQLRLPCLRYPLTPSCPSPFSAGTEGRGAEPGTAAARPRHRLRALPARPRGAFPSSTRCHKGKKNKKNKKRSNASASYLGITEGNPWVLHRGRFPLTPPEPCRAATPRPPSPLTEPSHRRAAAGKESGGSLK